MTGRIRRSLSYTQGVGYSTLSKSARDSPRTYGSLYPPQCIVVCESCGQVHDRGKNHLYDYSVEVDDDLMCRICRQPLVDPVDAPCGHTFCYNCALGHLSRSSDCPVDRQPICERDVKQSSLLVRKILDKLKIMCPNTAYCDLSMPRSSLETHLKGNCPGTYVHCPRERRGCPFIGPRCQLDEHLWGCGFGEDCNVRTGKKLPIKEGYSCFLEIPKGIYDLGLGISQCEKTGVLIVDEVFIGGNAYKDGRILPGDQIQKINDIDFTNKSLEQARLALSVVHPLISLQIIRSPYQEFDTVDVEEIHLIKDEQRPLGIQILSYKTQPGVYVYHLVSGSPAEECGSLQVGDRILEVNHVDLREASINEAATSLANSTGILQLLVAHRHRLSPAGSDMSTSKSPLLTHSSSVNCFSFNNKPSILRKERVYEEIFAQTGHQIGTGKCIMFKKPPNKSFGMNVAGGTDSSCGNLPIFISHIRPDSVIAETPVIQRGDIIVSINGIQLMEKTHLEAVETIKGLTSASLIKMELIQGDDVYTSEGGLSPDWVYWLRRYMNQRKSPLEYTITLTRGNHASYGFSIVGGRGSSRGDSPIYIRNIAPNSVAAVDGRLQCRDQITSINQVSVVNKSQGQVVDIIRSSTDQLTLTVIPYSSS